MIIRHEILGILHKIYGIALVQIQENKHAWRGLPHQAPTRRDFTLALRAIPASYWPLEERSRHHLLERAQDSTAMTRSDLLESQG